MGMRTTVLFAVIAVVGCGGDDGPFVVSESGSASVGTFRIRVSGDGLVIEHGSRDQPVFESVPGEPFVAAASGEDDVESLRGSFVIRDLRQYACPRQSVRSFEEAGDVVVIRGKVSGPDCKSAYTLRFTAVSDSRLAFELEVEDEAINRVSLIGAAAEDEQVFGGGTQYSRVDLKGQLVPVFVREQGIGRGLEPLTTLMNLLSPGSGGDWFTSYAAMPYFLSTDLRSMALTSTEYVELDFRQDDRVIVEQWTGHMRGEMYAGATARDVLAAHTDMTGRMDPLPSWAGSGAVLRVHGGSQAVRDSVQQYRDAGVPLAGVWIEDWVGERDTPTGSRLWWNWEADADLYPDWAELVGELEDDGVAVLIYFNPFLVDASDKANADRNLFAEAESAGYLVKNAAGETYLIEQGGFEAGLIDFTNPGAVTFMRERIDRQLDIGVSGWMADFGEALPYDAVLFDGQARSAHNLYPVQWARLCDDAISASGRQGIVNFHRSAHTESPGHAALFWLGDQLTSWDEFDGIATVVPGLISSGLSGMTLNHADIGGYLSIAVGDVNIVRSKELLLRWIELAAFTSFFRTHETNERPINHQVDGDAETLQHFARFARIFAALSDYRSSLMIEARDEGLPLTRHTWLVAPEEAGTGSIQTQFFLGDDLAIAPVVTEGASTVDIYLPAGTWVRVGADAVASTGEWLSVDAPIGEPAVFYRSGFAHASALEAAWTVPVTTVR